MTAIVDILTGEKSVLDYLLKPVLRAREGSLRERSQALNKEYNLCQQAVHKTARSY